MVVDALLRSLNDESFYSQGYADDFVILYRGAHLDTLMGLTRSALRIVELWCNESGLSVNPEKTELVVFTRKYKTARVTGPVFSGKRLQTAQSVKYLGFILDRKLNWAEHLEAQCRRFTTTFWLCRRGFGRTWGLGLRGIHSHSNNRRGGPDDGTPYGYGQLDEGGQTHQAPNEHYRTANSIDEA